MQKDYIGFFYFVFLFNESNFLGHADFENFEGNEINRKIEGKIKKIIGKYLQ